ncbi:VanZ family protein [Polaromonas sp.]|uniref:VanZ family protein n=1 Tax=Polaromonas sp. TaxID=1869339 RepID=UPI0032665501
MPPTTFSENLPQTVRILAALSVILAATALYILGAQPIAVGLFPSPWDKLAHLLVFGMLGAAVGIASGSHGWRLTLRCVTGAIAVGVMDELHQAFLPGRSASWSDLAADAAGGLLGAAALRAVHKFGAGRFFRHR